MLSQSHTETSESAGSAPRSSEWGEKDIQELEGLAALLKAAPRRKATASHQGLQQLRLPAPLEAGSPHSSPRDTRSCCFSSQSPPMLPIILGKKISSPYFDLQDLDSGYFSDLISCSSSPNSLCASQFEIPQTCQACSHFKDCASPFLPSPRGDRQGLLLHLTSASAVNAAPSQRGLFQRP